jgi:hypothetical protein
MGGQAADGVGCMPGQLPAWLSCAPCTGYLGDASAGVAWPVWPVVPPCRRDSGVPGVPAFAGHPARVRPDSAAAHAGGVLADGILTG